LKGGVPNSKGKHAGDKRTFKNNKVGYQNRGGQNSGDKGKTTDQKTHS